MKYLIIPDQRWNAGIISIIGILIPISDSVLLPTVLMVTVGGIILVH
jgi:hypothetical protein